MYEFKTIGGKLFSPGILRRQSQTNNVKREAIIRSYDSVMSLVEV